MQRILGNWFVCCLGLLLSLPIAAIEQEIEEAAQTVQNEEEQEVVNISLDVKGMDVVDVLKILSDEGGFNISISGNVSGRVTLFLKDIDVWDALEIVLVSTDLAYEKKGRIIYIMSERDYELKYGKKYWDKRKSEVFSFKHAKAAMVRDLFSQMITNVGKVILDEPTNSLVVMDTPDSLSRMRNFVERIDRALETRVFELNYLSAEDIEAKLSDVLTKEVGTLKVDPGSNKMVVVDYAEKLDDIAKVVGAFDVRPLQVLIDAKIVELTPSKKFYSGINWDYWIKKHFRTAGTFTLPTPESVTDKITFGATSTATASATEEGMYTGLLSFLQMFGETKVLSTPRILVLNNQEAKILVGTKEAYITSTTSEIGDSATRAQAVNFVDSGVKLYVTPTINREGYITLKVRPEISSATTTSITSENQETDIPIITTSEAETTLIVKDGVSILLGGLRKITRDRQRKQVPILGSLPLLGGLFRSKEDEWTKNELVIILTPRIVSGGRSIEEEIQEKISGEMWERAVTEEFNRENEFDEQWNDNKADFLGMEEHRQAIITTRLDELSEQNQAGYPRGEEK